MQHKFTLRNIFLTNQANLGICNFCHGCGRKPFSKAKFHGIILGTFRKKQILKVYFDIISNFLQSLLKNHLKTLNVASARKGDPMHVVVRKKLGEIGWRIVPLGTPRNFVPFSVPKRYLKSLKCQSPLFPINPNPHHYKNKKFSHFCQF
jgi:hypothetical protein